METDEFAERLMSEDRRRWQNPEEIVKRIGIEKGTVVADLACGPGFFTIPIAAKVGSKGNVYAVDSNPGMLVHLRNNIRKSGIAAGVIKAIEANVSDTGIPSMSVDTAFFANILHDVEDKSAFLKEIKRIVKRDSIIIDIDWHKSQSEHGPPMELRLTERAARSILSQNGLKVVRKIDTGPFHYGLVYSQS